MTTPPPAPDDAHRQAAALAFALVRFESGAAHLRRADTPPGMPRVGEDAYVFIPSSRPVPADRVVDFLAGLPSPALLSPTTMRGMVALTLVGELAGERAASGRHTLANQRAGLDTMAARIGLTPESRVLLAFGEEVHVVTLAVLRAWSERYAVHVGWTLAALRGDARAVARMVLFRSDGAASPGGPWRA